TVPCNRICVTLRPSTTVVALGEVAERPIAVALKATEGKLSGGSNPSLAAKVGAWDLGTAQQWFPPSPRRCK
ncbi:MAG: hypothetical protein RJB01_1040, partial [Actinomycetota bacterium]